MGPDRSHPKRARLRLRPEFRRVLDCGEVFPGREALVRRLETALGRPRLGISTPRGYGGSVQRNRFRRLVREAFRSLAPELGSGDYLVSPRRHLERPTLEGLRRDLIRTRTAEPAPRRAEAEGEPRTRGGRRPCAPS